ncbi:TetR/AcrR family transcriptional regulator [Acinetobacter sp. 161(2023)]|uniref:TetR/AcrR family transcriptional regulator n=1 Tax=Acinetobacter sp. 161(2023) TaxID=3098768 RepID=UPI003008C96B
MNTSLSESQMKTKLLDAAALLLMKEGVNGLTTRKIATAANTSTMAVYTHFGSINNLANELIAYGFSLLWNEFKLVHFSNDPLIDFLHITTGYLNFAKKQPVLYKCMFGVMSLGQLNSSEKENLKSGIYTLDLVVETMQRLIDEKMIQVENAFHIANEWWVIVHGYSLFEFGDIFSKERSVPSVLTPLLRHFLIGLGVDSTHVEEALNNHFHY